MSRPGVDDPLTDPRSPLLLGAQPDDVAALAAHLASAAERCETTVAGLRAVSDQGVWSGRAAGAFRVTARRLPRPLDRLRAAFGDAAQALRAYEPELTELQAAFAAIVAQLGEAEQRLVRVLWVQPEATSRAWQVRAEEAEATIAALRRQAFLVLDDFSAAAEECRGAVLLASVPLGDEPE